MHYLKFNYYLRRFALISFYGCTLILSLAIIELWNIVTPSKIASSPAIANQINPNQAVVKKLLGQWDIINPTSEKVIKLVFTPENKLFVLNDSSVQGDQIYKYTIKANNQPIYLEVWEGNQISRLFILELLINRQIRLEQIGSRRYNLSGKLLSCNDYMFQEIDCNSFDNIKYKTFSNKAKLLQKNFEIADLPTETKIRIRQADAKPEQAKAKSYIAAISRSQIVFFLEKNSFTSDFKKLIWERYIPLENYINRILLIDKETIVQNVILAKKDGLKSYTGIVYVDNTSFHTLICESNQPTRELPSLPKVSGSDIECPPDYSMINRY